MAPPIPSSSRGAPGPIPGLFFYRNTIRGLKGEISTERALSVNEGSLHCSSVANRSGAKGFCKRIAGIEMALRGIDLATASNSCPTAESACPPPPNQLIDAPRTRSKQTSGPIAIAA